MTPTTTQSPDSPDRTLSAVPTSSVPNMRDVSDFKDLLDSVDAHEKRLPEMSDVDLLAEAHACHMQVIASRAAMAKALAETVVLMHRAGRATCILYKRHRETADLWSFLLTLLQPATVKDLVRCNEIQGKHYDVRAIANMNIHQLFRAAMVLPNKTTEEQCPTLTPAQRSASAA